MRRRLAVVSAALAAALVGGSVLDATAQQPEKKGSAGKSDASSKGGAAAKSGGGAANNEYARKFASVCAACHGANGRSDVAGTPVVAGQHAFYAMTQLFLFREGRRNNEQMTAVAKSLSDADLRGFSDYIGTLPPVPAPAAAAAPDAARMSRGQALAQQHKCVFCHGADLSGGAQVPRIGGQKEEYLQLSLKGYKTGNRVGYSPAMSEALSQVPAEDLDPLAYYVARVPVAAAK